MATKSETPKSAVTTGTTAELVAEAVRRVGAVGKDRKADASMGGYAFRGIEDVANAIHPVLADLGLVLQCTTIRHELDRHELVTRNGTKLQRTATVLVEYALAGPDGENVPLGSWMGEGDAFDDKATNKAYSAALKLCLLQAFTIPTVDMVDTETAVDMVDTETAVDEQVTDPWATDADVSAIKSAVSAIPDENRDAWEAWKDDAGFMDIFRAGKLTRSFAADAVRIAESLAAPAPKPRKKAAASKPAPEPVVEYVEDDEPF